jgi:hypothetical protein
VEVTPGGIPGLADAVDPLAGVDARALTRAPPLQVHVHVVVAVGARVDHEVVAGAARLVAPVLDPAATRGDDRLAALREDVLALMGVSGAGCPEPIAVRVARADRELRRIHLDRPVVAL